MSGARHRLCNGINVSKSRYNTKYIVVNFFCSTSKPVLEICTVDKTNSSYKFYEEDESSKLKCWCHTKRAFIFFNFFINCGSFICQFIEVEGASNQSKEHSTGRDQDRREDFRTIKSRYKDNSDKHNTRSGKSAHNICIGIPILSVAFLRHRCCSCGR